MQYFGELLKHWRALAAAFVGLAGGVSLNNYSTSIFAPYLLQEFGWSKSAFALYGTIGLVMIVSVPIFGRFADKLGVRNIATVGIIAVPLSFLAFSMMNGDIRIFFAIAVVQIFIGAATTSAVYNRLIAERFKNARGLALAIVTGAPAIVAALGSAPLNAFIREHGWREGYQAVAIFSVVLGVIALLLIGNSDKTIAAHTRTNRPATKDYGEIFSNWAFWAIFIGMLLCNLPQAVASSQMVLMLQDNGATLETAAWLVSLYATGVIVGRFLCGLSLDHLPAHLVAAVGMVLPGIGLFMLASSVDGPQILFVSVLLIGVSQGAEGDLICFLVIRHFSVKLFSSIVGLVTASVAGASAIGAIILSRMVASSGGYASFLFLCGIAVVVGSALFLLLGWARKFDQQLDDVADLPAAELQPA